MLVLFVYLGLRDAWCVIVWWYLTFAVSRSRVEAESAWTRAREASRRVAARHVVDMSRTRVVQLTLVHVYIYIYIYIRTTYRVGVSCRAI